MAALLANNPIADWLLESTLPAPGVWTKIGDKQECRTEGRIQYDFADERLYPNYLAWCLANGREQIGLYYFGTRVLDMARSLGADVRKPDRGRNGYGILGLRLRAPHEARWDPLAGQKAANGEGGEQPVNDTSPSEANNDGPVNHMNQNAASFFHREKNYTHIYEGEEI